MEMIPLEETAEKSSEVAPPPEATAAGRESLSVETLENRVLLAADAAAAAPIAEPAITEPAPYVASPQTHHLDIDLHVLAETADAGGEGHTAEQGTAAGRQAPNVESHPPEAEKVEYDAEPLAEAIPDNKQWESEGNRDEFGLATIEPPKSEAEAAASRNALHEAIVDVAEQLDPQLVKAVSVETTVAAAPADGTTPKASAADETAILAQTVLKSEAALAPAATKVTHQIDRSSDSAAAAELLGLSNAAEDAPSEPRQAVASPPAAANDAPPPTKMPPAAHDALFADGQGVEAVVDSHVGLHRRS